MFNVGDQALANCKNCDSSLMPADRIGRSLIQHLLPGGVRFECRACGHKQYFWVHPTGSKQPELPEPHEVQALSHSPETDSKYPAGILKELKIENARLKKINKVLLTEIKRIQKEKRALKRVNSLLKKLQN